ncbi:MAG: MBL fold metallo-hydrolase [Rhodobiaceae bacterium]|nr:MBL fold metallo-hydrolase [Rhodobiaceae bacterium]
MTMRAGLLALAMIAISWDGATAQETEPVSQCLAVAQSLPRVQYASFDAGAFDLAALEKGEVSITFIGHSTFRIESPDGVVIATDYNGFSGEGRLPDLVTMNRAHSSHYTDHVDPGIPHVLKGWGDGVTPARHRVVVGDVFIRNVTTDIRGGAVGRAPDMNSIFIFEVAGLCLGHLGHLHHELTPGHKAAIGRLDVVFVPVDGSYTMAQGNMIEVLRDLRAQIVIPMHFFGSMTLNNFLAGMDEAFPVTFNPTPSFTVSLKTLPDQPMVLVLPGH